MGGIFPRWCLIAWRVGPDGSWVPWSPFIARGIIGVSIPQRQHWAIARDEGRGLQFWADSRVAPVAGDAAGREGCNHNLSAWGSSNISIRTVPRCCSAALPLRVSSIAVRTPASVKMRPPRKCRSSRSQLAFLTFHVLGPRLNVASFTSFAGGSKPWNARAAEIITDWWCTDHRCGGTCRGDHATARNYAQKSVPTTTGNQCST